MQQAKPIPGDNLDLSEHIAIYQIKLCTSKENLQAECCQHYG
jgi:hypothetical protein